MRELVPKRLIELILKLNLPMKLIANGKKVYPIIIKGKDTKDSYMILSSLSMDDFRQTKKWEIEIKGRIDVESVKYRGEVSLAPVKDENGYYCMSHIELYKENMRDYKRVPYRRAIQIISPIEQEAVLINISASGAKIHSPIEVPGQLVRFKLVLAKKPLELEADIVEEKYDETLGIYIIRCHFNPITDKEMKHINNVVKEIILMAKERLNK